MALHNVIPEEERQWKEAMEKERRAIHERRQEAGVDESLPLCGLALSGGGIRSATFCLGLIRALAKNHVLTRFDYLSTVSGGGYTGGMLGRLYGREHNAKEVERRLAASDTTLLWWLRNNGRYLSPAGARDLQLAGAQILRSFMLNALLVMWIALLFAAPALLVTWPDERWQTAVEQLFILIAGAATLTALHYWLTLSRPVYLAGTLLVLAAALALLLWLHLTHAIIVTDTVAPALLWVYSLVMTLCFAPRFSALSALRLSMTTWLKNALVAFTLLALLWAVGHLARWLHATLLRDVLPVMMTLFSVGGVGKLVQVCLSLSPRVRIKARQAAHAGKALSWLNLAGLLAIAAVCVLCADLLLALSERWLSFSTLLALWVIAIALLCALRAMPQLLNLSSLHNLYRARIERAWLSVGNFKGDQRRFPRNPLEKRNGQDTLLVKKITEALHGDDIELKDYQPHRHGGPLHLITCCINQTIDDRTGGYNADRKGIALTVSSLGAERGSRLPVPDSLKSGSLSRWLAISGAAVSSGLGSRTAPGVAFLIFLFGARLGYWQERLFPPQLPPAKRHPVWERFSALTAPVGFLWGEMQARFPGLNNRYWYLSDGGHFENTGVYALLKRRLPLIVLADCGADPDYGCGDLENLVRKAQIDLDTLIEFNNNPPARFATLERLTEENGSPLLLARLRYPQGEEGTLIVVKPRRPMAATLDTLNYGKRNAAFPQQGTLDQFFDEAQWEAYHQCGLLAGASIDEEALNNALRDADLNGEEGKKSAASPRKG